MWCANFCCKFLRVLHAMPLHRCLFVTLVWGSKGIWVRKKSKSLLLIGPLRVDVATCCDENQIFRQEVDAALVSSVEKSLHRLLCGECYVGLNSECIVCFFGVRVLFFSRREFVFRAVVLLYIWLSALINCVLWIFWRFPQISVATARIRLPSPPAVES